MCRSTRRRTGLAAQILLLQAAIALLSTAAIEASEVDPSWACVDTPLVITNARLPEKPDERIVVEIRGSIITRVGAEQQKRQIDRNVRVLDAEGAFLLPGLIDAHAHLDTLPAPGEKIRELDFYHKVLPLTARSTLSSGVTAARIHLSRFEDLAVLDALSNAPCFPGPRLQLAGPGLLGGAPGVASPLMVGATDPEQIAAHIFRSADLGAQWLALHRISRFSDLELRTIEDAARGAGLKLMAAADQEADFRRAIETSVRTLEYLDRSTAPRISVDLVARSAGRVAIVPPIGYYRVANDLFLERRVAGDSDRFIDEAGATLYDDMVSSLVAKIREDTYVKKTAESFSTHKGKFEQLREAGVALLPGSDSGSSGQFHHRAIWNEATSWHRFGASSSDILRAGATASHWLDWPGIGEIRVGNHADLLLHRGDPSRGFARESVTHVLKGGVVYVDDGEWIGPDEAQTVQRIQEARAAVEKAERAVKRRFCTEIGSLDFTFYKDQIIGNYLILPRQRIGTFFGTRSQDSEDVDEVNSRYAGRWMDPDGEGDILVDFSADLLSFTTRYRSDKDPETWYTNWGGARRRGTGSEFEVAGTRYRCE